MQKTTIQLIQKAGFVVHMRDVKDCYCYFTDLEETKIGYLEESTAYNPTISTVHKPNRKTGTGFGLGALDWPNRDNLERAFIRAPHWASGSDLRASVKWASWDAFKNSSTWNQGFQPVPEIEPQTPATATEEA